MNACCLRVDIIMIRIDGGRERRGRHALLERQTAQLVVARHRCLRSPTNDCAIALQCQRMIDTRRYRDNIRKSGGRLRMVPPANHRTIILQRQCVRTIGRYGFDTGQTCHVQNPVPVRFLPPGDHRAIPFQCQSIQISGINGNHIIQIFGLARRTDPVRSPIDDRAVKF